MTPLKRMTFGLLLGAAGALSAAPASANERHFTYTYESAVLPAGQRELEFWTTWRNGRAQYYSGFDHRVEYEFGITDRLDISAAIPILTAHFSAVSDATIDRIAR